MATKPATKSEILTNIATQTNLSRKQVSSVFDALNDQIKDSDCRPDPTFGVLVPRRCPGVPNEILDPKSTWKDPRAYDDKVRDLWKNSLDDWGQPLRPANLNRGVYKGGRRPIDLYWRIAKGINGAKMPAHYPTIEPERIWDLVNFVLELPYEPKLLHGATLPSAAPAPAPAVARR